MPARPEMTLEGVTHVVEATDLAFRTVPSAADRATVITRLQPGDANMDLEFNQLDIVTVLQSGSYLADALAAAAQAADQQGQARHAEREEHHEEGHHDEKEHHDDGHDGEHHDNKRHDEKAHKDEDHHDEEHHGEKAHEDDDHHDHTGLDPHIWLSPPLVILQARSILTALQAADPTHGLVYENNYRTFILDIVKLDADLRAAFDGLKGSTFMVFHPSWGTFAHTYGLKQVPIEIEGKRPKPAQLKELIAHARSNQIKVVFVQPQFSAKSGRQIAKAIGGRVAAVDPLAADWATNLRRAAEEFKHAFQ